MASRRCCYSAVVAEGFVNFVSIHCGSDLLPSSLEIWILKNFKDSKMIVGTYSLKMYRLMRTMTYED